MLELWRILSCWMWCSAVWSIIAPLLSIPYSSSCYRFISYPETSILICSISNSFCKCSSKYGHFWDLEIERQWQMFLSHLGLSVSADFLVKMAAQFGEECSRFHCDRYLDGSWSDVLITAISPDATTTWLPFLLRTVESRGQFSTQTQEIMTGIFCGLPRTVRISFGVITQNLATILFSASSVINYSLINIYSGTV
jgi:hypothetical protein